MKALGATLGTLMRRVTPPIGLRSRIVGALLLTSAATLAVAALALLGPLEAKLRDQELRSVTSTAQASAGAFASLSFDELNQTNPVSKELKKTARSLVHRTHGRVLLVGNGGQVIFSSDPDESRRESLDDTNSALARGHTISSFGRDPDGDRVARVAVPFHNNADDGEPRFSGVIVVRKSVSDIAETVRVVRRAFLTAAAAGLGIALLLGIGLATGLLIRLRRLRNAALQVAEVGPGAEVAAADRGRDEVADLSRALATMQARLRQQEEARRAFISTASHELRTPLASLGGMLELLEDELGDEQPSLDAARLEVERARTQAERLSRLASDLLDLSRLDAEVPLRSEPVELDEVGRAVVAEFELRSDARGVKVDFASDADHARALGDPGGVARIARILVDNAVRVAPPDSTVRVHVHGANGRVELEVADAGPGVPEQDRERIFERFQRGADGSDTGGFGLGLAIGRELAERMGGRLELADSRQGARFVLSLDGVGD